LGPFWFLTNAVYAVFIINTVQQGFHWSGKSGKIGELIWSGKVGNFVDGHGKMMCIIQVAW